MIVKATRAWTKHSTITLSDWAGWQGAWAINCAFPLGPPCGAAMIVIKNILDEWFSAHVCLLIPFWYYHHPLSPHSIVTHPCNHVTSLFISWLTPLSGIIGSSFPSGCCKQQTNCVWVGWGNSIQCGFSAICNSQQESCCLWNLPSAGLFKKLSWRRRRRRRKRKNKFL